MYICSYLYKGMLEYRVVKVKVPNQPPISCLHRLSCRMVLAVLAICNGPWQTELPSLDSSGRRIWYIYLKYSLTSEITNKTTV